MSINRIIADNGYAIFEDYPPLNNEKILKLLEDTTKEEEDIIDHYFAKIKFDFIK